MKSIQIESGKYINGSDNNDLLRAAGVQRIFPGWYTVWYNGVILDASTACSAARNRGGKIKYDDRAVARSFGNLEHC